MTVVALRVGSGVGEWKTSPGASRVSDLFLDSELGAWDSSFCEIHQALCLYYEHFLLYAIFCKNALKNRGKQNSLSIKETNSGVSFPGFKDFKPLASYLTFLSLSFLYL